MTDYLKKYRQTVRRKNIAYAAFVGSIVMAILYFLMYVLPGCY